MANKQPLPYSEFEQLNSYVEEYKSIPDDHPMKKEAGEAIQAAYADLMERFDPPNDPVGLEDIIVDVGSRILDYGAGLERTAVLLPADIAAGNAKDAPGIIGKALVGQAPIADKYFQKWGVPEGGKISGTKIGKAMGVKPGSFFDFTGRGTAGAAVDTALSPGFISGLLRKAAPGRLRASTQGKSGRELHAARRLETSGMASKTLAQRMEPFKRLGMFLADPAGEAMYHGGEKLYRSAYGPADRHVKGLAGGLPLPSDIAIRNGMPVSASQSGLAKRMKRQMTENSLERQGMLKDAERGIPDQVSSDVFIGGGEKELADRFTHGSREQAKEALDELRSHFPSEELIPGKPLTKEVGTLNLKMPTRAKKPKQTLMSLTEADRVVDNMQKRAKHYGAYATDKQRVKAPSGPKADVDGAVLAEVAGPAHAAAATSGTLEIADILDAVQKGDGGDYYRLGRESASLLNATPVMEELGNRSFWEKLKDGPLPAYGLGLNTTLVKTAGGKALHKGSPALSQIVREGMAVHDQRERDTQFNRLRRYLEEIK